MCEPATIGYGLMALVGGYAATKAMKPPAQMQQQAEMGPPAAATPPAPTPITPPPVATPAPRPAAVATPRQQSKAPAMQQLRSANAGAPTGRNAGQSSTMLTGPSGIDAGALSAALGRNTLLGQ